MTEARFLAEGTRPAPVPSRRLDASPQAPDEAASAAAAGNRTCLECGRPYAPRRAAMPGDFCSAACRAAWNNRRAVRGAELYDLFMALRFDRDRAKQLKVWRLLNRMAAGFRDEDVADRGGRPSWRPPHKVIERRPYLRADVLVGTGRKGGKR